MYEGMQILQDIYDRRHITNISMASDWIAEKVTIRESHHAPYRYVMAMNRVKTLEESEEVKTETYDNIGDIFMELLLSGASFSYILKIFVNYLLFVITFSKEYSKI